MHIDTTGFLWIGTQRGLFKYDGTQLVSFSSSQSGSRYIASSDIRGIDEDINGNLLVATHGGGLLRWNNQTQTFDQITRFGSYHILYIKRLLATTDGTIWISNNKQAVQYDLETKNAKPWGTTVASKSGSVGANPIIFSEDRKGKVYITQSNQLAVIDTQTSTVERRSTVLENENSNAVVTAMEYMPGVGLLLGTNAGNVLLLDLDTGDISSQTTTPTSSIMITDFLVNSHGIFVATNNGLHLLNNRLEPLIAHQMQNIGLSSRDIYSLLDFGEYVFVGTYHGLNVLSFSDFELFQIDDGNHRKDFLAFEEGPSGELWIGTYNGLYSYDEESGSNSEIEPFTGGTSQESLSDDRVTALAKLAGELWIGFYSEGIDILELESRALTRLDLIDFDQLSIVDLMADPQLGSMWIATYNRGLIRITDGISKEYLRDGDFLEPSITRLFKASRSRFFVSSFQKFFLYRVATDDFDELNLDFGLNHGKPFINSIREVNSGDIWLGTREHGVFVWTLKDQLSGSYQLERPESLFSFQSATVYSIEQGHNNLIWVSTDQGILETDAHGNFRHLFTVADGLQSNDFSFGSSFIDSQGRVYFGGPNGYNRFHPEKVKAPFHPTRAVITRISSPNGSHTARSFDQKESRIFFSHRDYFITFEFSIMDFVNAGATEFRYILENFDQGWVNSGRNYSATYTNLPPGDYRFTVQGMNSSGIWDEQGASISLTVLPPFWKTGWAYTIYVLVGALMLWLGHRVYHSYVVDRRAAAMNLEMFENEERADDEMQEQVEYQDELIKLAYRHKRDTLDLVSTFLPESGTPPRKFLEDRNQSPAHKRLRVLSILEQHIVYGPNGPMANLFEFVEALLPELMNISDLPTDRIVSVNKIPDTLIPCDIGSPLAIIIYELIANALEHAFEFSSPVNYLFIDLELHSQDQTPGLVYRLSVTDNGIGCPQNLFELAEPGSGIGIVLAMVDTLGGNVQMQVDDGTSIIITLPVRE